MERRDDPFTGPLGCYDPSPYDRRLEHDELLAEAQQARNQARRRAGRRFWWQVWRRSKETSTSKVDRD